MRAVGAALLGTTALAAVASPPARAASPSCIYDGATGPIPDVVAGATTITVTCADLGPGQPVALTIESPLAQIVVPASAAPHEASTIPPTPAVADATGALTATIEVPVTFAADDPAAACPPTQAQVNAGVGTCTVSVRDVAGALVSSPGQLVYRDQRTPSIGPSLVVTNGSSFVPGDTVALLGTGYWGSLRGSTPTVAFGATAAEPSPVDPVAITGPTYNCAVDGCAIAPGVLVPGQLLGKVVVPSLLGGPTTITARQPNATPFPGNGPDRTVQGAVAAMILGSAVAYAGPGHGGVGMPVMVTGTGWDPQGAAPILTVLTAQPGHTASAAPSAVDANGNLSGVITIGAGDAVGVNPILVTQVGAAGLRTAQALFTVDASASCGPDGCSGSQALAQSITTGGLSMSQVSGTVSFGPVTLNGTAQVSRGALGTVTVLDGRGTLDGWSVTATLSGDFVNDAGTGANYTIPATSLRWVPRVELASAGSGVASQVAAGSPARLSSSTGRTLCSAALGGGGGAFSCDADLFLDIPASVALGTYSATINITIT